MRRQALEVAFGGALTAQDDLPRAAPHPASKRLVRHQPLKRLAQFAGVADFDARFRFQQGIDRVAEAELVWAEQYRNTLYGRFHYVVAALVAAPGKQAAAHKGDVGGAVQ